MYIIIMFAVILYSAYVTSLFINFLLLLPGEEVGLVKLCDNDPLHPGPSTLCLTTDWSKCALCLEDTSEVL